MAITIISNLTANKFYPSSNPINTTVSSNNSGKCNFRYICDIYLNSTKVFTDKIFPDPITGYGFFQLSRVIQDYIKTTLSKTSYTQILNSAANTTAPSSAFSFYLRFGEEYDNTTTCDGDIIQYVNLSTSNTSYVFESAIDYEDFPTFNYTNYLFATQSGSKLFLTNTNRDINITYNDPYSIDFISLSNSAPSYIIKLTTYDYSNSPTVATFSNSLGQRRRFRIACGPIDVNRITQSSIINPLVKKYTIEVLSGSNVVSEVFNFNVKAQKAFNTRIGFVGLLGSLEHFTFYHRNRKSFDIQRKQYSKLLQSNYSGQWKYEVGDRGDTIYGVQARETHAVSSYCTKEESNWLYEMWMSPEVWTYKRPELLSFRPFQEGSYVKFWVTGEHGLVAGDKIFTFTENSDYNDLFTITSVSGNIVDCGLPYSIYGATMEGTCGVLHKDEAWQMLPITISDNTVEVKQRTSRPIEYSLNYQMSYTKNTLR